MTANVNTEMKKIKQSRSSVARHIWSSKSHLYSEPCCQPPKDVADRETNIQTNKALTEGSE